MEKKQKFFDEFISRELETMDIFLTAKAARSAITIEEYIQARIVQGATEESIKQALFQDLEEGGRIFSEFRNAIKATVNGVVNRTRDNGVFSSLGVDAPYRWVAVMINTCPDCLERHNKVMSWAEWEMEGLPRTGQTVCKENCKCFLIPAEDTEIAPIDRKNR